MSEFCHCDQILVNNFSRTRGSEHSLPRAGTVDSGLVQRQSFATWEYVVKLLRSLQLGSREKVRRKRSW